MTVTKVLQEQSGIQYQGVQDKSEADPRDTLTNVLFTGVFKRGRFDQPFKVTKESLRAKVGFDPSNPDFVAIEDALEDGAPYLWLQRIEKKQNNDVSISCEILTNDQILTACDYMLTEAYTPEIGIAIDAIDLSNNIAVGSSIQSALDLIQGVRLHFIWVSDNGVDKVRFEVNIPNLTEVLKTQNPINYEWWMTTYTVDFKNYPEIYEKLKSLFTADDLALVTEMKLEIGFECIEYTMGGQSKLMMKPWSIHKLIISPFQIVNYDGMVYNGMDFCYKKSDRIMAVDYENDTFIPFQEIEERMPLRFGQNATTYWATYFDPYNIARQ